MTNEFENAKVRGIHISRYIASWVREGGSLSKKDFLFEMWLEELGLNEDEIAQIMFLANNGKMELEHSAKRFIEKSRIDGTMEKAKGYL